MGSKRSFWEPRPLQHTDRCLSCRCKIPVYTARHFLMCFMCCAGVFEKMRGTVLSRWH